MSAEVVVTRIAFFLAGGFINGTLVHLFWERRFQHMKLQRVEDIFAPKTNFVPGAGAGIAVRCSCGHMDHEHKARVGCYGTVGAGAICPCMKFVDTSLAGPPP